MALGYEQRCAILDGNAKRVLARYHAVPGWPGRAAVLRQLWDIAEAETPQRQVGAYTQAIMDLGATVCTPSAPACGRCPLTEGCTARAEDGQNRYPGRRPTRRRPLREQWFVWMRHRGRLLLEQRPPVGLWGGLLCLPQIDPELDPSAWCQRTFGRSPRSMMELEGFNHDFSHFRLAGRVIALQVTGLTVRADAMLRWLPPHRALAAGLPAPMRHYIQRHTTAR